MSRKRINVTPPSVEAEAELLEAQDAPDLESVRRTLRELEESGEVVRTADDKWSLPGNHATRGKAEGTLPLKSVSGKAESLQTPLRRHHDEQPANPGAIVETWKAKPTGKADYPVFVERDGEGRPGDVPVESWPALTAAAKRPPVADRIFPYWSPRPRHLPEWRREMIRGWQDDGYFAISARLLKGAVPGAHDFIPLWERDSLDMAQLWFVGEQFCALMDGAARDLPPVELTADLVPDDEGLVVFERPLAGIDSETADMEVAVGAYLWGRAYMHDENGLKHPCLGITVYGPGGDGRNVPRLLPLGGLVWPFGATTDVAFGEKNLHFRGRDVDLNQVDVSMIEDRRRLAALWLLSSQPGLAHAETTMQPPKPKNKAKAKRLASGALATASVRVIALRHAPSEAHEPTPTVGGRKYRHRWSVGGHWRNQAYGPAYSQHRPVYINPYLKGPEDAPLLTGEKVKAWIK